MNTKFLVINIEAKGLWVDELDKHILKDYAYSSKFENKLDKSASFQFVLVPVVPTKYTGNAYNDPNLAMLLSVISTNTGITIGNDELMAIHTLIKNNSTLFSRLNNIWQTELQIDVVMNNVNLNFLQVSYCDGSFSSKQNKCGYGVVKLTHPIVEDGEMSVFSSFLDGRFAYKTFNKMMEGGSNNVGELSGLECVVDNFDDSQYQVIVSDSEYALKCFREWIYNWRKNGYKTYSKKPISNKEQIMRIEEKIKNSGKIIFYKWVQGHNLEECNELCDELAKQDIY